MVVMMVGQVVRMIAPAIGREWMPHNEGVCPQRDDEGTGALIQV